MYGGEDAVHPKTSQISHMPPNWKKNNRIVLNILNVKYLTFLIIEEKNEIKHQS